MTTPVLDVRGLCVQVAGRESPRPIVRDVSFTVRPGEVLGAVGESGSGKSLSALAVLGLLPDNAAVTAGEIRFDGTDLRTLRDRDARALRGARLAMIYQDPTTSLNPIMRIGPQVAEGLRAHGVDREEAKRRTLRALDQVGLPRPERIARSYPHQLSGGMQQRAMIAAALVHQPSLLVADEPTTALDVTIQQQIIALVDELRRETGLAVLWITHDLGVLARIADRVAVMYAGRLVEEGRTVAVFDDPQHPYTAALLASIPVPQGDDRPPLRQIGGRPPDFAALPSGCAFHPRCPQARDKCTVDAPPLTERTTGRAACWVPPAEWRA